MTDDNDSSYSNANGEYYEEEYCDRVCAELCIYSGEMSPFEVTRILGIQPTDTDYAVDGDEQRIITTLIGTVSKPNAWFLSSESFIKSTNMRRHIDWLTEKLKNCSHALKQLQETDGIKMYVACIWWVNLDGGGPILRPKQMRDLADLNLKCAFDFQFCSAEINGYIPGRFANE